MLSDAAGEKIDFKNTIIIMTSNLGLRDWSNYSPIGFGQDNFSSKQKDLENKIKRELQKFFLPELLNRVDKTIIFNSLDLNQIEKIIELQINQLNKRLNEQNLEINLDKEAIKYLARLAFTSEKGARGVRRVIEEQIEDKLANFLLENSVTNKNVITFKKSGQKLELKIE